MEQKVKIEDIIPYENNPRKNDQAVPAVMESFRQCGYLSPIVVDENMVIINGHTRLKAAKRLGWTEMEVRVVQGLTEEQKRKARLLDNKTSEYAEWDIDKLVDELEGLDFGDFDFGFDDFLDVGEEEAKDDDYDVNPPEEPKSKIGEIYQLGRHRLMCGDSTKVEDVRQLVGGVEIDLLLTDPPYGVSYVGKTKDALKNRK